MAMSQNIIIPYCTCNIYEPQQNTPKTNELPSEFSHFWRYRVPYKNANQAAFQKLSEAFEQLQPAASHPATGEKNKLKRKREKPWWDVPTWEATWVEVKCVGQ